MKKLIKYEEPKIELILLDQSDVITTSPANPFDGEEDTLDLWIGQP